MDPKKIEWYRTPVDKVLLKELATKSDFKGLRKTLSFLLGWVVTMTASVYFFVNQLWVPLVVACYVHSTFLMFFSMAAGVHELSHGTMFKTKLLNEFFYHLFCWMTWNNPVHFRASHGLHHQLTVFKDPDKEVVQGPVKDKLNFWNLLQWFTFDWTQFRSWFGLAVMHTFGKADADYFFWNPLFEKGDKRRGQMVGWARFMLLSHLILLGVFVYFQLWVLIYLVTFGVFFASWYGKLCGAMQHTGLGDSTPDWRLVCHTFTGGPLTRWLYWNMNYHTAHHMYAAVPCYNEGKLHRAIAHDLPPSAKSLWSGLRLLFEIRKRQKSQPDYVLVPKVPEKSQE